MHDSPTATLDALGFDEARRDEFATLHSDAIPGRVIRIDRGMASVRTEAGDVRVITPAGTDIAVGDWIATDENGTLRAVLDRRGAVTRLVGNDHDVLQVVAANVDLIFLVRPLDLSISPSRVQAMLTLTYDSGATPVVLLTKADLAEDPTEYVEAIEAIAPGIEVVVVSVVSGLGVDRVREVIAGHTVVFLGESGGGKSTLTNLLVGEDVLAVGETSAAGQGRHTTSHRELVSLPGGGAIIDTPGMREVVAAISREAVDVGFADVADLTMACRFSDCSHGVEPGCAVVAALTDGTLSADRFAAYEAALRDAAWNERRADKAAQAATRKNWQARARQLRTESWS